MAHNQDVTGSVIIAATLHRYISTSFTLLL